MTRNPTAWILLLVVVLAGCRAKQEASKPKTLAASPASSTATNEQLRQWLEIHNLGLGYLESHQWTEAIAELSKLRDFLPGNVDVARNLAIARTLSIVELTSPYSRTEKPDEYSNAIKEADNATKRFSDLSSNDEQRSVAALLNGRLLIANGGESDEQFNAGLDQLRRAVKLSGDKPEMWFALAHAMDSDARTNESVELIEALKRTAQLAPENLRVLGKLAERQAIRIGSGSNEEEIADLKQTLNKLLPLVVPFNTDLKRKHRLDVQATIQKALAESAEKPRGLVIAAIATKNVLLPELVTQIDMPRIEPSPFDLLAFDLIPGLDLANKQAEQLFAVSNESVLTSFIEKQIEPAIENATDIQSADMNLDGRDDFVALQDGEIVVYSHDASNSNNWTELFRWAGNSNRKLDRFILVDVDRDYDKSMLEIKEPYVLRDRDGDRKLPRDPTNANRWFDSDLDVVAWNNEEFVILKNEVSADGIRTLVQLPQSQSFAGILDLAETDLESDGDLDLVFATKQGMHLMRNVDGANFAEITEGVQLPDVAISTISCGDWNHDIAMDVIAITQEGKIGWLQNIFHSRFRWLQGLGEIKGPSKILIDDINGDSQWDLVVGGQEGIFTLVAGDNEKFSTVRVTKQSSKPVHSLQLADLDNDGHSDVIATGPTGFTVLRGTNAGNMVDSSSLLPGSQAIKRATTGDIDDDGDLDIIAITSAGKLTSFFNQGGNKNNWIDIVARADANPLQFPSRRINMHGIGSKIELRTGQSYQAHLVDRPKLHLGLGKAEKFDVLRMTWTDGIPQPFTEQRVAKARLGILAPQILLGSCPYIYTWDGEKFTFFSDCLWAAPIGLVQATGDLAPTREWEYLAISGDRLKPKDGRYQMQLTEELWEAAYFDEVQLIAVDHPQEVEIFTNEKVGSGELASPHIHTIRNRVHPKSVRDGFGRDLSHGLAAQDQYYVQAFRGRIMQGLTDEWTMEFDLGPLQEKPKSLRMVMIGWVFPTNTSLNLAIEQNKEIAPPLPPQLEVVDQNGAWRVSRPFIGFPGGKTKAMVVDLSDVFINDNYRFRIRSSMELYWDTVFFTLDEDVETRTKSCQLVNADLHYRGYSRRTYSENALFRDGHAPEGYDYSAVTRSPRWSEMLGRFTRYGRTTELVSKADDQLVVMGPGDELTLEFDAVSEPPPHGWTRDFILYNVGWDKDADLNTVLGQSSEPYPFRSMKQYPPTEEDEVPANPEYNRYLRDYQTRQYPRNRLRNAVRNQRSDF